MGIRRKFVVVDTQSLMPLGEPPYAIDRVRIQSDQDIALWAPCGPANELAIWTTRCQPGDTFKYRGFVYVCAVMWSEGTRT